jgi:hypothetical protein
MEKQVAVEDSPAAPLLHPWNFGDTEAVPPDIGRGCGPLVPLVLHQ